MLLFLLLCGNRCVHGGRNASLMRARHSAAAVFVRISRYVLIMTPWLVSRQRRRCGR